MKFDSLYAVMSSHYILICDFIITFSVIIFFSHWKEGVKICHFGYPLQSSEVLCNYSIGIMHLPNIINLLLQGADNLPGCGPFSWEFNVSMLSNTLPHILHRYSLGAVERLGFEAKVIDNNNRHLWYIWKGNAAISLHVDTVLLILYCSSTLCLLFLLWVY